MTYVV